VDSTYLQPVILVPPDRSACPLTQKNESRSDIDTTQFVDDSAYYQPMDGKDGTFHFLASERFITHHCSVSKDSMGDGLRDEETQTEPHETTFESPHRDGANRLLPPRPSESAMSFDSENTMVVAENGAFNEQLSDRNFYSIFSGPLQGVFFQNFPLHLYVLPSKPNFNQQATHTPQSKRIRITNQCFIPLVKTSDICPINDSEAFMHQSNQGNSCPGSDTEMESASNIQSPTTGRVLPVGRKEER
jgi:hypothetical protein